MTFRDKWRPANKRVESGTQPRVLQYGVWLQPLASLHQLRSISVAVRTEQTETPRDTDACKVPE